MTLRILLKRNCKLFFKDKGLFFTSLITPLILLVLYTTFLGKIYHDSFMLSIPAGINVSERVIQGCVAGQLVSSLLSVSCITVAFCSNMLMVQDKANGNIRDFSVSPVRPSTLSVSYYLSSLISTLIIAFVATAVCLIYVAVMGFYMSVSDVLLLFLDTILLVMFGTALSSVINFFLSTQGQISAVGSIVSSCYGFICGAYMPISQFSEGLQTMISFLPGTYGTSLLRNHAMRGAFSALEKEGIPIQAIEEMRNAIDANLYFFDGKVSIFAMYAVLVATILLLLGIYILLNLKKQHKKV